MNWIDWLVLASTLTGITVYGILKSRGQKDIKGYLLGDQSLPWYHIMFSVMATQASAITFLSAPGQAYNDGMRFVQYYFGLPLAMVVICIFFLPLFHRMRVYTAYEYLESRFDIKTRALAAFLFLIQRGLAAGLTIYAPSIILSSLLGWNIYLTNILMGGLVIVYTVSGGSKAVSYTQLQQMSIALLGMLVAGIIIVQLMPEDVTFSDALFIAGKTGKLNAITTDFDFNDKYNIWCGLIGGFFLMLAYFGTDQSQVGRYLSGKSIAESRTGLLMNSIVKIPMQFSILLIGALMFTFYQFNERPVFFNDAVVQQVKNSEHAIEFNTIENAYKLENESKEKLIHEVLLLRKGNANVDEKLIAGIHDKEEKMNEIRKSAIDVIQKADPLADTNDTNYIFLNFVIHYLPAGLIGLLIAVIFSASWSSTSSELNALAGTTVVDFYKRFSTTEKSDHHYLSASKWITLAWGIFAVFVAMYANKLGSLIEAVNKLGSLFYGTILGIFLVAFFFKKVGGNAVFYAAIVSESIIFMLYYNTKIGFLWFNPVGAGLVIMIAVLFQSFHKTKNPEAQYSGIS